MPLPAQRLRFVPADDKTVMAPELSLRGGQRPTWRPEREARGSALGVQSREGSCDFADGFPVVRPGTARLPRRFAPRNDKFGGLCDWRGHPAICQPARRSVSAATDAIGACRFIGGRYESSVPSRDCRVASPLAMTIRGPVPFYRQPVPTVSSAPGGACPSPTTRDWKLRVTLHYPLSVFHLHHAAPTTTALIRIGGGGHVLYICLTGARTSCSCGAGGGPAPP